MMKRSTQIQAGFTLVEMALVLLIVTLLMTGLVPTISSQFEQRYRSETRKQLDEIRDALLGFAVANGRLPCPASTASNGAESFAAGGNATNGNCSNFYDGYLPAATLGITPTDSNGYALDGWSNRIRYAVTTKSSNAVTVANGIQTAGMAPVSTAPGLLYVCDSATGITATTCGTATNLTNTAVAVIYSVGKNSVAAGTDEAANLNGDQVFVSHVPSPNTSANGEFEDVVTWLSPNILYNRMVAAGKLP
jgi:prepilin-type N-terminal cleavage/methylation domain-containing protein